MLCLSWSTGRFITVLWVLCKRFSLYKKVYQGWAFQRSGSTDSLQLLQSPPNSSQVTHDSSSFHSLSCFKTPLHRERIKGRKSLQLGLNSALPLPDSDTAWDSNYSHSGWETVSCSRFFSLCQREEETVSLADAHISSLGYLWLNFFICYRNRETISLVTYASFELLARRSWRWINE